MNINGISAITLTVEDMSAAVLFYTKLGMNVSYGGVDSTFTTLRVGQDAINLMLGKQIKAKWWGRVILRVDCVDSIHRMFKDAGLTPEPPRDAEWGERYFHISDPDGNELSFAQVISSDKNIRYDS